MGEEYYYLNDARLRKILDIREKENSFSEHGALVITVAMQDAGFEVASKENTLFCVDGNDNKVYTNLDILRIKYKWDYIHKRMVTKIYFKINNPVQSLEERRELKGE